MSISRLEIKHLRNLNDVCIEPATGINLIYGQNGSGKTSLLEAIHYLGLARSFRTHSSHRIIQHDQESFSIFALLQQDGLHIPIGIERKRNNDHKIRVAGKNAESSLELAELLPLQFINNEAHRLLSGGPKFRRQFLDWGVFHVERSFISIWQRAFRALKQRNAALRTASVEQRRLWDHELAQAAVELDALRASYMEAFIPLFNQILRLLLDIPIQLHYYRGWPKDRELIEVLSSAQTRDIELGYSQFGPQRADLQLRFGKLPAQDALSQGQQKLVVYALRLAQGKLLSHQANKKCLYLIDDLPSELDHEKQQKVADILNSLQTQIFITGIEQTDLEQHFGRLGSTFHVEQGKIMLTKQLDY